MVWLYVGAAIIILGLIAKIVRWWNLPAVAEARAKRAADVQKERTERQANKLKAKEARRLERLNKKQGRAKNGNQRN